MQSERVAAPKMQKALRSCASTTRQVLSARGGEEMQGERVCSPQTLHAVRMCSGATRRVLSAQGGKGICRVSDLLRPLNRKGQSCAAPSDIAGAGASVVLRPQIMQALRLCASAARQVLSARGGERCRASELLRPGYSRRCAHAQAPFARCSAHRAEKDLQGERLAAPSES